MFSIIICSINEELFAGISNSISNTIGEEYEIIRIDNTKERSGITAAYNKGAAIALYKHLIFVHEDVSFNKVGWGTVLFNYFKELENPGVLGVMGADYIPYVPSGWYITDHRHIFANMIQGHKEEGKPPTAVNINGEHPHKVFTIDGAFIAVQKEVWETIRFDETIKGFHGYDLSFSLQVANRYNNYFVPGIGLTHNSEGTNDKEWFEVNLSIRKQLFDSLSFLEKENKIDRKIEKTVLYNSFLKIASLENTGSERRRLIRKYFAWSVKYIGFLRSSILLARLVVSLARKKAGGRNKTTIAFS